MGYIVRQTVSSDSAAATENVTSMINLKKTTSSADAKNVSVTSEALSSNPSYNREKRVYPAPKVCVKDPRSRMGSGCSGKNCNSALGRLIQEDCKSKAILGHIVNPCLKIKAIR
jgi:hypothetical protein